jgi:CO/xanthine dehydrogenase Mo-binding subunit
MEAPEFVIGHCETPSPWTPHGIKGGRMMAPAVIAAAIDDALAPLGVRAAELPATPARIVGWTEAAGGA